MSVKFLLKRVFLVSGITIMLISCKRDSDLENEIAQIGTDIRVERFDQLFSEASISSLPKLKDDYPFLFAEKYTDSFWIAKKEDTIQQLLFKETAKAFSNFEALEEEIESFYNHLKYYFPEFTVPRVITSTSMVDYRNKVIVTDTILLVSLDTYLGDTNELYEGIQKYIVKNLRQEQIVVDMSYEYAKKYMYQAPRKTLLDEMIYFGKILYFTDVMLPFKLEEERIGYTEDELEWAKTNESYIWRYFVERELLYSTDAKLPNRFINPAPFTKFYLEEIDQDSPGRLGQYIGWQIVKAYMENNEVFLKEMLIKEPEDIFNNSKFKPRK